MEAKNNKEIFVLKFSQGGDSPLYKDAIPFELEGETYYVAPVERGYGGATIVFKEEELIKEKWTIGDPIKVERFRGIDFPKMFTAYTESRGGEYQHDIKSINPEKVIRGIKNNPEEFLADYKKSFEEYTRKGKIDKHLFPVKTIDTADKGMEKGEKEIFEKAGIGNEGPDINRDDALLK